MKKMSLLVLAVLVITACQNKPERYFDQSPEIETVKSGIKAYDTGDWETWNANFADTAKIFHNTDKGLPPKELMKGMQQTISQMDSYGFSHANADEEIEMIIDKKGRTWVNYWNTWQGVTKVTGKELKIPVHLTIQFVDGKIVREYGYYDTAPLKEAFEEISNMSADDKTKMEAVNKVVDGWNAHDISNLKALSVSNFVRTSNGVKEIKHIDEYAEFMKTFVTAFPDFKVYADKVDIAGDKIYINWTVTGTHNGDFMGNAPTGKKIKTKGFSIWTLNNSGKFISEDAYYDNLALYSQLGINPPPSN